MLDIDHFKQVNDTYGHHAGGQVIQAVARRIVRCVRSPDLVARYGGEEFVVLLPDTGDSATGLAERIRDAVADVPDAGALTVTISAGIAHLGAADTGMESLLNRADQALYRAKETGRNRVATGYVVS